MRLLIKNASLPDEPISVDIQIENGTITKVARHAETVFDCDRQLDASGLTVLPSFVDMHAHLRTPGYTHKETLESGCAAAVRGGYTALCAMANTKPVCSDAAQAVQIAEKARSLGLCDVYQCLSLTRDFDGKTTSHLDELARADAGTLELVRCVSEDGYGVANSAVFLEAVGKACACGRLPLIHAEDAAFSATDMKAAEELETLRDLYLLRTRGLRAHFCHVSTRDAAQAIIDAKAAGVRVSWEVSPHHLALSDSTVFRVNPPLRPESDRAFLVRAAIDGLVDAIATDHAPHTAQEKASGAPGLVGLETAFGVCHTVLCHEAGMPLAGLADMMGANPRRLLGLSPVRTEEGYPADLVLVDTRASWVVDSAEFASMGRNTPFQGMTLRGRVCATIKNGEILYKI